MMGGQGACVILTPIRGPRSPVLHSDPEARRERRPPVQDCAWPWTGRHPLIDRLLRGGDTVGGFKVLFTPGHTSGDVSLFRPSEMAR